MLLNKYKTLLFKNTAIFILVNMNYKYKFFSCGNRILNVTAFKFMQSISVLEYSKIYFRMQAQTYIYILYSVGPNV